MLPRGAAGYARSKTKMVYKGAASGAFREGNDLSTAEPILPDPKAEYTRRLEARRTVAEHYHRLHIRYGNLRLIVAGAAGGIAWMAFDRDMFSAWWLLAPAAVFVVLALGHDRIMKRRKRASRAVGFYRRGLDRLENRWAGKAEAGLRFRNETHPYGLDLDLFGKGGLFELMSVARTRAGEETLAHWLLHPASLDEIRARQAAIEELRPRLDLREDFALLGEELRHGVESEPLPRWGEKPPLLHNPAARLATALLALAALVTFVGWVGFSWSPKYFMVAATIEAGVGLYFRRRVLRVVHAVEHPAHDLDLMAQVLVRLEQEEFSSPMLVKIQEQLKTSGEPPSRRIARLDRLVELLDSRENVLVRLIGPPLMWTTQLAFAVEAWRRQTGPAVRQWLRAVGQAGALFSLANYAFEHPDDPYPEFVDGPPVLDGEGLGHPLLPPDRCVRNDVRLDSQLGLLLVSGSNMSGKSTLLRTVGTNVVLAMAGAPVCARRLRMTPFAVGACIRVTDSLQTGKSRFFSEITRLRQLMDLTSGELPLLFLLDELLHGTNSHDRRIGAEAVLRSLLERRALGLATTHDLAITQVAEELRPRGSNVHFEDRLENGRISFDYILRPGVVQKSNALELMRSVGLEV